MKIDTLNFLAVLLTSHAPHVLHPHIGVVIPAVVLAVEDSFYKITSEALLVLHYIVKTIRPSKLAMPTVGITTPSRGVITNHTHLILAPDPISPEFQPFVLDIYHSALKRLMAADIDQEVKERAISCMGQVLAGLGDSLGQQLTQCLPIFVERLKNEITRLTTVRAITLIVK